MRSPDLKYDFVVACIGNSEQDESIIISAYNRARALGVNWKVLHVSEKSRITQADSRIQRLIRKAKILEAEVIQVTDSSVKDGIISYGKSIASPEKNILFVIGVTKELFGINLVHRSLFNKVKKSLDKQNINVESVYHVGTRKPYNLLSPIFNFNGIAGVVESGLYILIATVLGLAMQTLLATGFYAPPSNVFGLFLIACLFSSIRSGLVPGVLSAVLSLLCINFIFFNHFSSLEITSTLNSIRLLVFFATALIISGIGSSLRFHIIESRQKEAYLNALLSIGETLNRPLEEKEALSFIHHELELLFRTEIAFFTFSLMDRNNLSLKYPARLETFNEVEANAFEACRSEYMSTGTLTPKYPDSKWYFEPMMSSNGFEGILAIKLADSPLRHDKNILGIMLSFADLSATIIDRIERTHINEETKILSEKDKLRTMILSSVSHDLKTPLATIIGSLDVFHNLNDKLTEDAKSSLTKTAYHEAIRLDNFITNILDMAKLESGSIKANMDWVSPADIAERAIISAKNKLGNRQVKFDKSRSHEIFVDQNLLLRAFAHLFDNISKYTPDDSQVNITHREHDGSYEIFLTDNGPGIEKSMLEEIFNKYTRIKKQDSQVAGTGLGLPLSRNIIELHNGHITAVTPDDDKGLSLKITLPNYRKASA